MQPNIRLLLGQSDPDLHCIFEHFWPSGLENYGICSHFSVSSASLVLKLNGSHLWKDVSSFLQDLCGKS